MRLVILLIRLLDIYQMLIVVWCLFSWLRLTRNQVLESVYEALGTLVEPYIGLFRRLLPPMMGVDFTPVIAIVVLQILERVVIALL